MKIRIEHNLTHKSYEFDVTDSKSSAIFYDFELKLPQPIDDGEYEYTLSNDGGETVATGLIQIGDYVPKEQQSYNNKESSEYVTYNG